MTAAGVRQRPGDLAGRRVAVAAVYLGLVLLYWLTMPGNRYEGWDGYFFAYGIEQQGLAQIIDTRLLLFRATMRCIHDLLHGLGLPVRAHGILVAASLLSAPAALLLFHRLLATGVGIAPGAALLATGMLGASYGFWRYAGEAEAYAPSAMLVLATAVLVIEADRAADRTARIPLLAGPAVLAGLATLFYQPNAIPVFLALPLMLLRRDRLPSMAVYVGIGGAVVVGGYAIAYLASQSAPLSPSALLAFANNRTAEFDIEPVSMLLVVKSLLSLAHDTLSTNWIFAYPELVETVRRTMPGRFIDAEIYAAARMGALALVPLVALPAFVIGALWSLAAAIRHRRLARPAGRPAAFVAAWFVLYALIVGRLDANSFEPWIMALPPLVALFGIIVVDPVLRAGRSGAPRLLLGALVLHNGAAMASLASPEGDAHRAWNAWLIENARPADLIVTPLRHFQFEAFVRYHVPAPLVSIEREGLAATLRQIAEAKAAGGRIYAYDDMFDDLAVLQVRNPALAAAVADWVADLPARPVPGAANDAGTLFEIEPDGAN